MTTTAAGKPRLRAFAACIECNKAKVKCDGDKPNGTPCTRCTAHTLHCAWAKSKRGRLPGSKNKPKQQQQQQQSSSKEEHEDSSPASPVLHQDFQQQQHQQPPQQQQQQQHQQHAQRASTSSYMLDPLPQQPTKRRRVEPQESDLVDYQGRFQAPPQPPMPQPDPSSDMMFWNHNSNSNNNHNQPGATFAHRISRPGSSNSQHPQYHYHQQARYLGHAQMPPPAPMGTSTPSTSAAAVYPPRHNPSPSSAADFSRFSSFGHDIGASFNPAFHFELNHLVNTPAMPPPPPQNAPSSSSAAPGAASGAMNQLPIHHAYQHQLHHQMQTAPHASSAQQQQQQQQQHAQSGLSHFPGSASGRLTPAYPPQYASSSSSQHFVLAPPAPLHPPPLPSPPSAFGPSTSAFSSAPTSTPFPPSSSPPTALGSTRNPVILPPPPAQPNQGRPGSSGGRSMAASSSAPVFLPPHPPPPQLHQGRPGSAGGRSNAAPSPIPRVGSTTPAPSQIQRRPMVTSAVAAAPSSSSPAGTSSMKAVHRAPLELYSPSDPANPLNLLSHAALTSKHDGAGGGGAGRAQGGGGGGGGGSSLGARLDGMRNNGSPRDGSSSASPHSSTYYSRPSSAAAQARWGGGGGAGTGAGAAVLDGSAPSSSLAGAVLPPIRDPHLVSRSSSGAGAVPQQGHRAQHVAGSAAEGHWHHDLAARDGIRSHAGRGWQENDEDDERILGRGDRSAAAAVVSRRPNVSADQNNLENRVYPDRDHLSALDHRRSSLEETSSHTHSHPSRDPNTSSNDTQPRTVLSEQERLRRQRERRKSTQARTLGMLDANAFDETGPGDDVRGRAGVKGGRAKARGAKALRQPSSAVRRRDLTRAASAAASSATRRTSSSTLSPSQASSSPSSSSSGAHSPSRSESQSDGEEEEDEDEDDVDEDDDDDDESESGSEAECDASNVFAQSATKLPDSNAGPGPAAGPARDARPGNRTAPSAMDAGARAGMKRSSDDDAAAAGSGGAGGDPSRVKAKHRRKSASAQTKTAGGGGGPTSTRRDAAAAPPTKLITEEEEARVLAAYRSRLAQHGWTESKVADAVEERRDFFSAGIISSGTDVRDVPHVVALGILTEGEVDDLFDFYFRELNTTCAFLDPNLHTPTYVRARSSFLYTVICFAASSVDPRPSSQAKVDRLDKLAREQVLVLNEENARSCEIVQAMLLYNLWALENGTCARDRGSAFVVHAVRMALELGLDVTVKDPTSPEQHTREGRNKLRAFITAVIQDRSLSAFTGRQPVAKLDEYGTGLTEWVDISPVAIPADVEDVGFVTVRLLEQDIRAQLAKTDPSDHVALERVREAANTRMGAWMEQWTTKPILNEAPITRGTMKVVALHVQLVINTVTKSACRDRKADCLRIASELLMIVNTELHDSVQYIPRTIQGMIAWAAVVVIQLTDGDIPSLAIDTALLMAGNANDPYRTRTFARFYGRFLLATIESVHSETMHSSLSCSSRLSELEAGEADARDRPVVSLGDVPNGGGPVGGMEGQAGLADPMEWANDAAAGTNGLNQRGDADQEPSFRPAFENMLPPEVQQQQQSQSHSASSSSTFPTSVNSSAPTSQFSVPLQNSGGESTTMPNDNSGSDANAQHLNIQQAFSLMDGMGSTVSNAYNLCASTTRSYGDEAGHSSTGQQQQQQQQHQQDRQRMHFHGGSHGGHSTVPNGNGGMGNGAFSLVPVPSLGMGGAGFSGFDDNFLLPPGVNWETFLVGDVPLQRRV
ncbi:unnamed protein product [Tilletia controversa]|nr:unnamed protein product [Tilletia controversa]